MGAEAKCTATVGDRTAEGKALLETDRIIFRSPEMRLDILFESIAGVEAREGRLDVWFGDEQASFELGVDAQKWARRILNPPTLLDKLGVKPGARVSLLGVDDDGFADLLRRQAGRLTEGGVEPDSDFIFFGANTKADLERLLELRGLLKKNGAIWVIRPRGVKQITEADVMEAGKAAGLVDTKVARFSDTHTAEKFVIPVARR